jgi:hypothetical protein
VGVDFGGLDIGVTHKFLDDADSLLGLLMRDGKLERVPKTKRCIARV